MKRIVLPILLILAFACSKSDPNDLVPNDPDNGNPDAENPQEPDPNSTEPEEESFAFPYAVAAVNWNYQEESEMHFDRNGEEVLNISWRPSQYSDLLIGLGKYFQFSNSYLVFKSFPSRAIIRELGSSETRLFDPVCGAFDEYVNSLYAFSESIGAILTNEVISPDSAITKVDILDLTSGTCNSVALQRPSGYTRVFVFGEFIYIRIAEPGNLLFRVNARTLEIESFETFDETMEALTVRDDQIYLFYYEGSGQYSYEIRDAESMEILSPRTLTTFIPHNGLKPFFKTAFLGDQMLTSVLTPGPSAFGSLPAIFSFEDDSYQVSDWFALYRAFEEDYYEEYGDLPHWLDFTDFKIDMATGNAVVAFRYQRQPVNVSVSDQEGGFIFTNIDDLDTYTHFFIDERPDLLFVDFNQ